MFDVVAGIVVCNVIIIAGRLDADTVAIVGDVVAGNYIAAGVDIYEYAEFVVIGDVVADEVITARLRDEYTAVGIVTDVVADNAVVVTGRYDRDTEVGIVACYVV